MLKRSLSCWPTMSRILSCCPNLEAKCPWRCWGPWTWAKGEDHDGFEVDWGAWTDWSWSQGVWGCWVQEAASTGQGIMRMRSGWGVIWRRRRGLCPPDFSAWFAHVILMDSHITTCTAGEWMRCSNWPTYSHRGSACCLNYHLLVIVNIFLFFICMNILCLCQNGFSGTTHPILHLHLWENLSQLMLPVLKPIMMYFCGWKYNTLQCPSVCFSVTSLTLQSVHLWIRPSPQRVGYFHFPVPHCISFPCTSCFDC